MTATIDSEVEDFMAGLSQDAQDSVVGFADDETDAVASESFEENASKSASKAASKNNLQRRQESRLRVNWRVALLCNDGVQQRTIFGKAKDISLEGMSILFDENLQHQGVSRLLLEIPSHVGGAGDVFVEIQSKPIYSVLSAGSFQVGMQFMSFANGGKSVLELQLNRLNLH